MLGEPLGAALQRLRQGEGRLAAWPLTVEVGIESDAGEPGLLGKLTDRYRRVPKRGTEAPR